MNWTRMLNDARKEAGSWIGDALAHRRNHPAVYALAHAYAATHYRKEAAGIREARGKRWRFRSWSRDALAFFHRRRREKFERMAQANAETRWEASQCAAMMREKAGEA